MDLAKEKKELNERKISKLKKKINTSDKIQTVAAVEYWKTLLSFYEVTSHISLTQKETGMMKKLISYLRDADIPTADFLEFAVSSWGEIRTKLTWPDNPKKFRLGEYPYFQEIFFNKEDLMRLWGDKKTFTKAEAPGLTVYTKADEVPKDHPNYSNIIAQIEILGKAEVRTR